MLNNSDYLTKEDVTEYISLLLSYTTDKKRAPVAADLLASFVSGTAVMRTILDMDVREIMSVADISMSSALLLKLVAYTQSRRGTDMIELGKEYTEEQIDDALKACFIGSSVESVYLVAFDENNKVCVFSHMGDGTVNGSDIYPRKLLETAIMANATSAVIAHNHPRGSAEPSRADILATERLAHVFCASRIKLKYHLVVCANEAKRILTE